MTFAWLPASQLVVSALEDHPAGTLIFPFEPYRASEAAAVIRVDHAESPVLTRRLVYTLNAWPDGRTCSGELLALQQNDLYVGWRLEEGQRLVLENDLYGGSIEEGGRNPRGGLLRLTQAGARLTGLRDARGHAYGSRPTTFAINPTTWRVDPDGPSHHGIMYQAQWRLRLELEQSRVVTIAESKDMLSVPSRSG